jgi:uridine kinase
VTAEQLIEQLTDILVAVRRPHPVRVALDGVDAAGKTTLADALAPAIRRRGRPVIRASVDGFHRPRAERRRRGPESPEGYYHDSFDYPALRAHLLLPLGPGGDRQYRRAVFDFRTDSPVVAPPVAALADAILLCDGVFLLRPELDDCWDYRIFVAVDLAVALQRAVGRDQALFGGAEATRRRYLTRYIPGQQLYLRAVRPQERADAVVANDDPLHPGLLVRRDPMA